MPILNAFLMIFNSVYLFKKSMGKEKKCPTAESNRSLIGVKDLF